MQFSFDFNFVTPIHFLDRYLSLMGFEDDQEVRETAIQILVLLQFDDDIIDFNTSIATAVALILATNIVKMNNLIKS